MMSGKKLISIIIGILFTQSLFSQYPGEVLFVEESSSSKYFVEFIVNGTGNHSSMTTILTINGYAYSKTTPTNYQLVSFYTDRIDNGFRFAVYNDGGSSTFLFTKEDIQNQVNQKASGDYYIHQLVVHSKTALTDFAPLIVCTNEVKSLEPTFDSEFAFDRISGTLTIDGFSHTYSRANPNNVSFSTSFLSGVSFGESHTVSFTNEHFRINSTSSLRGFYLLEPPPISIECKQPQCHGESGTITLSNFPSRSEDVQLRIDIIELVDEGSDYGCHVYEEYEGYEGELCFKNAQLLVFKIDQNQSSLTLKEGSTDINGTPMTPLTSGYYKVKAFYYAKDSDGKNKFESLCSVNTIRLMTQPDPLNLDFDYIPIKDGSPYHTIEPGGTGSVKLIASGGREAATYKYRIGTNASYVDFVSNDTLADRVSGNVIYLSNSDTCTVTSETIKFTEPVALTVEINDEAENTKAPTCSSTDNVDDDTLKNNGQITFTTSGGVGENSYKLLKKGNNDDWSEWSDVEVDLEEGDDTNIIEGLYSGLPNGIYKVAVTDDAEISADSDEVSLIRNAVAVGLTTDVFEVDCNGGSTTISFEGFDDSYSYFLNSADYDDIMSEELLAGSHEIVISKDGCSKTLNFEVNQPSTPLNISIQEADITPDICEQGNGKVTFSITGGKDNDFPYYVTIVGSEMPIYRDNLVISNGEAKTGQVFDGLKAGQYTLKVFSGTSTGNNPNCQDSMTINVLPNNPLKPGTVTKTPASCYAVADGSGVFTVTGLGSTSISTVNSGYSFTQNADKITVNGLKSTSQTITLTDTRGCTVDFKNIIGGVTPDSLYINATKSDLTCPMVNDGTIEVQGNKGRNSQGYKYQLEKKVNGSFKPEHSFGSYIPVNEQEEFGSLPQGIYRVSVQDNVGCVDTEELTISSNENPVSWDDLIAEDASCDAAADGYITIEGVKGNELTYYKNGEPYSGNAEGIPDFFEGLTPGNYAIKVMDGNGCYVESLQEVKSKGYEPSYAIMPETLVACDDKFTGEIRLTVDENVLGSLPYNIQVSYSGDEDPIVISESALEYSISNLTNQSYSITLTDAAGCSTQGNYLPSLHSPALTLTENWIDASCLNVDGAIEMSATGGISEGSYDFYFDDEIVGQGTEAIIYRAKDFAGQVKVEDDAGCVVFGEENQAVRVRETAVEISNVTSIHPSCIGDDDGRIEFSLRGDSDLEYSYILTKRENPLEAYRGLINPGEVTIPYLSVGIYDLIVVEAPLNANSTTEEISQWCSDSYPGIEVTDWESVEVEDFSYNYIDYFGEATGSMEVTISGGSQVYDYEIVREVDNTVIESGEIREGYFTNNVSLLAGNYNFRFRDVNQCMYFVTGEWYEQPFTIEQPDEALFLPVQVLNNLSCFNSGNGRIEVAAQGGWGADYTYKLEGPVSGEWQSDGVFENLMEGTYSVLVRDSRAVEHQFTDAFTLTQPAPFSVEVTRTKDATCPGYNNGEVDVVSTNGVYQGEGLKYQIYTEGGEEEVVTYSGGEWKYNKLVQGSYTVEVTDANGCVADDTFAIGEPEQIEITSNQNYIRAKFDNTGEVSFEVSKGNGYYEYSWALEGAESSLESGTTEGTLSFEDLPAGDYVFMLRDTARCRYEGDSEWMVRPIRMEEPEFELNFDVLIDSVTCNGLDDGKLSFNGIGGWGDYEFSFEGGDYSAQDSVEMLAPGVYNLAVRDAAGIIYERPIEVFEPEILSVSEGAQLSDVSCFGGSDGSISVDITGGNLAYFVSSDGENWFEGNVVKYLPIGQFDVFVKDAKGCETSTGPFTLNQPSEIVRDPGFSVKESTCQKDEGAIYADFSGGTGTLSYTWLMERVQSNGSFETEILTEYATSSIEGLYAGHYMVDVMDEHGCVVQFPFDVNDNTDLSILSIDTYPVSCYGYSDGAAKAEISFGNPPYRYTWRGDGLATLGDSAWNYNAGEHRLSVWDEKGCYVSEAFEVGTPDSLFYQITEQIQPLCLGGAKGRISLAGTGGTAPYQYEWNDGTKTAVLEGVDPGDYQLVMTDSHACVSSFDFDFNYQRTVELFIGNDTLICHYNTLKLDAGDYSIFEWHATTDFTSSNRFVEVNQPASYFLKVTDGDNCIGFDTLSLDVSVLEISDISTEDIRCAGLADGEATVTINSNSDNYTIEWPDGGSGTSSSGYAGGEYSVLVQNEYGCSDTLDYTLFEPDPLTITTSFNEPLCLGVPDGYVRPVVSGGIGNYRYQWNQGETKREISRLSEGNYVFTVTDDNDCWLTDEYYLAYKRTLLPDLGVDRVICHGNSVFLDPGSFNKLSWYYDDVFVNNDSILEAQLPGEYRVIVNDEDNCIGSDSIEIETSGSSLLPSFLMATSVPMGDTLLIVEVTQPKPKAIEWEISGAHRVVETDEYFTKVIFDGEGIFPITLSSFSDGGCIGQARKSILVTAPGSKGEGGEPAYGHKNMISLVVSPNPSQGQFNAQLKMHEPAPVTFYLVRIDTGQIYETRRRQGLAEYNESFTHSGAGQFVLFSESGGDRLMVKIITF